MVNPSTVLTTAATALTTSTEHPWAVAKPFDVRVKDIRQGRIFTPYHSEPSGYERWMVETDLVIQTELMVSEASSDIAALSIDYSINLGAFVKSAFSGVALETRNQDRHAAIMITNRSDNETLTADVVLISTVHLYRVQFKTRSPLALMTI